MPQSEHRGEPELQPAPELACPDKTGERYNDEEGDNAAEAVPATADSVEVEPETDVDAAAESATETENAEQDALADDVLHYHGGESLESATEPEPDAFEEAIIPVPTMCLRVLGTDCERCRIACPNDAISYRDDGLPLIDANACTKCGICYGICDGLTSTRVTIADLRMRVRKMATHDGHVYITCTENIFPGFQPADNVLVVPCLASLPPELLCAILCDDIEIVIACDLSYCEDCRIAPKNAALLYTHSIQLAEDWTGCTIKFAEEIPEQRTFTEKYRDADRRGLFTGLIAGASDVASGKYRMRKSSVLQDFEARREQMHASSWLAEEVPQALNARTHAAFKRTFPRRTLLLEALEKRPFLNTRIPVSISETDAALCDNTLACAEVCPTGARHADKEGFLAFDSRFCIGCGLCVNACPHHACSVIDSNASTLEESKRVGGVTRVHAPEPQPVPQKAVDADEFDNAADSTGAEANPEPEEAGNVG